MFLNLIRSDPREGVGKKMESENRPKERQLLMVPLLPKGVYLTITEEGQLGFFTKSPD
jgi:hypothetical protein